jgi:hypothetical protein
VVPSLSLEIGSLFRETKRAKGAKTAKRFFFVLFADFCPFCFPKKPKIHYLVGPPQNPMRSANLKSLSIAPPG